MEFEYKLEKLNFLVENRKSTGNQSILAHILNRSDSSISRILSGERHLTEEEVPKVAEYYHVSPSFLKDTKEVFGRKDDMGLELLMENYLQSSPEDREMMLKISNEFAQKDHKKKDEE